jgi:hypothetical protein
MIAPEAHGLSRGRWNNIRSLFRKSLALVRPMMAGRSAQPILPEWQILAAKLPVNRRFRLASMFRFLSARGKKPTEVTHRPVVIGAQMAVRNEFPTGRT